MVDVSTLDNVGFRLILEHNVWQKFKFNAAGDTESEGSLSIAFQGNGLDGSRVGDTTRLERRVGILAFLENNVRHLQQKL